MIKDEAENNNRPLIFEVNIIITQRWVHHEQYLLEGNLSRHNPMLYNLLFIEEFVTVKDHRNRGSFNYKI